MIEDTRVHMEDGVPKSVEGRYYANGRQVKLFGWIQPGQTSREKRVEMRAEARRKLGIDPE